MDPEKIKVRVSETGQTLDVVVYSKRADRIEIVLGEGIHNVKCELTPTRMGLSYAGSVRGGSSSTSEAASRCKPISTSSTRPCVNPDGVDDNTCHPGMPAAQTPIKGELR
jgi:hypothetical protein